MKFTTRLAATSIAVAAATAMGAAAAHASPITVPTFSFESPVPTANNGTRQSELPSNWTFTYENAESGGTYIYNVVNNGGVNTGPITSGVTGAQYVEPDVYVKGGDPVAADGLLGTLANTASVGTFAADTTYTLTVSMTSSKSLNISVGMGLSDAALTLETMTADNSVLYPSQTAFTSSAALQDEVFTLDTAASANTSLVGQDIFISLLLKVASTGTNAANFDNVRLDATPDAPVPEPASLALLGVGGLMLLSRRRNNKLA